jgi:hypothetical protein
MEKDKLQSLWQGINPTQKSQEELSKILKDRSHPVLKSMKKQILIELIGFTAFLFCYYTMFDGAAKPLLINVTLIVAIALPLLHNLKGYRLQKQFKSSSNLKDDLTSFVAKLKSFRVETMIARIAFVFGFLLFFTYNIEFSQGKWWATLLIMIAFSIQLFFLYKIWSGRINRLKLVLQEFSTSHC